MRVLSLHRGIDCRTVLEFYIPEIEIRNGHHVNLDMRNGISAPPEGEVITYNFIYHKDYHLLNHSPVIYLREEDIITFHKMLKILNPQPYTE